MKKFTYLMVMFAAVAMMSCANKNNAAKDAEVEATEATEVVEAPVAEDAAAEDAAETVEEAQAE